MTTKEYIISLLNRAVELGTTVQISTESGLFKTYHDPNGQRLAYLKHYGYSENSSRLPGSYSIHRRLSFTNTCDEGKEDAVLGVLTITEPENTYARSKFVMKIDKERQRVQVGDFIIYFRNDLKVRTEEVIL